MADRAGPPTYEQPLCEAAGLTVTFATDRGPLQAVRGVDLEIHAGAVLGVVGESGSGKSVTALALVRLLPPHARATAGRLRFRGEDVTAMRPADLRRLRGGHVGMVFQEPARSFDPIYSIERSLAETLRAHARTCRTRWRATTRSGSWKRWGSRRRRAGSAASRTSSPAACCSG